MAGEMVSINPFADLKRQCRDALRDTILKIYSGRTPSDIPLNIPPDFRFGQLTSSICFELSKDIKTKPLEIAEKISEGIMDELHRCNLIERVKAEGSGYINFYANFKELSALAINSARRLDDEYGYVKTNEPKIIIVEHTSVNPVHPIHIGQARNSVLGDSIARILTARGHKVSRHYYIDDVGRQSALIAYGYEKLGRPKPEGKPDHFIGMIYSITSCLVEIRRLKKEIERKEALADSEELNRLRKNLDEWISVAAELESKYPEKFNHLLKVLSEGDVDPEHEIAELNQKYEAGDREAKELIREVCKICLEGFKETLGRASIFFDSWDWESDFIWSGDVKRCIENLKRKAYVYEKDGALEFDGEKVAQELGLKETLGLREDYEIPSLTLVRADGTTLYTTRDIAYSIWKFSIADKVINVVGMEQTLAQLQLKLALYALGHVNEASNLVHFAYNLVNLPGHRMSSRRGRYVTFDEVMDEAARRAYNEVSKRSPAMPEEEKRSVSEAVGIGAVKYALIETDPIKPVVFTWDRVINFEKNSAPYIQYSHARACSIIRKAQIEVGEDTDYSLLKERLEHELVMMIARFPEVFIDSADNLKPNAIADYTLSLADKFNGFYARYPVIKADSSALSRARLGLVDAVRIVLRNSLNLLGIEALERM